MFGKSQSPLSKTNRFPNRTEAIFAGPTGHVRRALTSRPGPSQEGPAQAPLGVPPQPHPQHRKPPPPQRRGWGVQGPERKEQDPQAGHGSAKRRCGRLGNTRERKGQDKATRRGVNAHTPAISTQHQRVFKGQHGNNEEKKEHVQQIT